MPKKVSDEIVTFTVSKEVKEALEQWAKGEDRSMSYLVRRLVEEALKKNGYFKSS